MAAQAVHGRDSLERMQRCINDLVSLLALPAIWVGNEPASIARTLLDALLGMLDLDFAYLRFGELGVRPAEETLRIALQGDILKLPVSLGSALVQTFGEEIAKWPASAQFQIGGTELNLATVGLGLRCELGIVVLGSRHRGFPDLNERLLLNVSGNMATVALQEAYRRGEQARLNQELDDRVSRRTAELLKANAELRKEVIERRRAEEALRESEVSLRKIINTLPTTAWSTRSDGYCDYLSDRWLDYAGVSYAQAEGWGWVAAIHPDDLEPLTQHWESCLESGTPVDTEARMRRFDGQYRWFLFRANPLRDEGGKIIRWYGTNIDIEDRKRAAEALAASERDLKLTIDSIPGLTWFCRADGWAEFLNKRWRDYTGMQGDEGLGWNWAKAIHPDDLPELERRWREALASNRPDEHEARVRRFDGEYRWFLFRTNPSVDESGAVTRWYGTNVDIEDRKRAEQAVARSEAFLAEAQKISATGSFCWRLDTDELTLSEELYRILEFDRDSIVTRDKIRSIVHPDDLLLLAEQGAGLLNGDDVECECRLLMPDGRVKHVRVVGHAVDATAARQECVGSVQDITAAQVSAAALDGARHELARVTRIMSLGALAASIAHEVNQPLAGIVTNAGTCLRMLAANPPNIDGARETARRTIRDGNRAAEVIARLRKLFANKAVATELFDLNGATREVLALLSLDLLRGRVNLRVDIDDDQPAFVMGDRVQLQQVISNLIRNASEAMSEVYDHARELEVSVSRNAGEVTLTVRDAGTGFRPEEAERLFDAFYTTKNEGMGIGLSVSRTIIEGHGGRLWATPNDGPGATFGFSVAGAAHAVRQNAGDPLSVSHRVRTQ
jgi:PAS domain S-box-containing protein